MGGYFVRNTSLGILTLKCFFYYYSNNFHHAPLTFLSPTSPSSSINPSFSLFLCSLYLSRHLPLFLLHPLYLRI